MRLLHRGPKACARAKCSQDQGEKEHNEQRHPKRHEHGKWQHNALLEIPHDAELVTILVGPELTPYNEPKELLCHYSMYFDACLKGGNWKEARELKIALDDVEPSIFEAFLTYMYSNNKSEFYYPKPESGKPTDEISSIIDFLIFADRFWVLGSFSKDVPDRISELIFRGSEKVTSEHIRKTYQLPRNHIMRRLIVDACFRDYVASPLCPRDCGPLRGIRQITRKFPFMNEVEDVEDFASDLSQAFDEMVEEDRKTYAVICAAYDSEQEERDRRYESRRRRRTEAGIRNRLVRGALSSKVGNRHLK